LDSGGISLAKYRNRLQIVAEILRIVSGGAKKTHIMYKANLSYKLLCKYLDKVLECGLVQVDQKDGYMVAPKGKRFLMRFDAYMKRREHVGKEMKLMSKEKVQLEQMYASLRVGNPGKKTRLTR